MTWSFNNTALNLLPMNEPIQSVQELRARIATKFPEHAAKEAQREAELDERMGATFQKFTTQLFMARAKQREKEVLAKPPGR